MEKKLDANVLDLFDFDIDVSDLCPSITIDDVFYVQDLKQRKLYLSGEINDCSVSDAVRHILQFNADDKGIDINQRKPILLYLSSIGGNVDAGFQLIDVIENSKTPVYSINLSYQYSMGFLIGLSGHKRYCSKNAKFLLHDGQTVAWDSAMKAQDKMDFYKKVEARIKDFVLSKTKISSKEYNAKLRVEWYFFADEAKNKGVVDYVIGEDVDLDEIV